MSAWPQALDMYVVTLAVHCSGMAPRALDHSSLTSWGGGSLHCWGPNRASSMLGRGFDLALEVQFGKRKW